MPTKNQSPKAPKPSTVIVPAAKVLGSLQMLEYLDRKIAEVENSVKAREHAVDTWRSGDDASWARVGNTMSKTGRLQVAAREERIAAKCRVELETLRAIRAVIHAA